MGITILNSDTLGISRGDVRVFFKQPQRWNIFQQVRSVEDFSTRFERSDLCIEWRHAECLFSENHSFLLIQAQ